MSGYYKSHVSIELNSRERDSGSVEDCKFLLGHQIKFSQKPSKSYWLRLENTMIPRSFYTVDSTNNVFQILEDDGGGGDDTITITVDAGNYTITELITEIESQLDADVTNLNDYLFTYDDITNKLRIILQSGSASADATIDTIANGSTINVLLGLGKTDTAEITGGDVTLVLTAGTEVAAPNCVNLDAKSYVSVLTNIASDNYYDGKNKEPVGVRVPINVDRNVKQFHSNDTGHLTKINTKSTINSLELKLVDEFDNLIDLNECDWSTELNIYELTELHKAPANNAKSKNAGNFTTDHHFVRRTFGTQRIVS